MRSATGCTLLPVARRKCTPEAVPVSVEREGARDRETQMGRMTETERKRQERRKPAASPSRLAACATGLHMNGPVRMTLLRAQRPSNGGWWKRREILSG
jgi:hypothetical protein